ncbi:MAG: ABC transporter substrate-binding protein [Alphaproteobacteria bacterium]|nr:ABC transporter substrate-binding protein [Alphaproteobacteria bacterium]MDX5369969.1 ABC transporter substrate-binding protein [Alphaproteobacteria bacterium]
MRPYVSVVASALVLGVMGGVAHANTLTVGLSAEPTSIDPHFHNLSPNNSLLTHVFEPLIAQDAKQRHQPALAVSWRPVNDTTWEFKLRQGVTFHDGSAFNADDVVFSFERAPNVPNSPSSFKTYTGGKTVKKVDDYTVHFMTEKPYPLMPNDVSTIFIVSNETSGATTEDYNSGKAAVGTGQFKFVEYVPGDRIVVAKNDGYWGEKAAFDKVTFKPIKSDPARVAALLAGDVDMIEAVPTTDIARLKADGKVTLSSGVSNRVIYFYLDQYRENTPQVTAKDGSAIRNPFLDQRVREAVSLAINRQAIADRVMEGASLPAGQLLPDGFFGTSSKISAPAYNPTRAIQLLGEAGYSNGFKMVVHGPNDRYLNDAKIVEAVAQMLNRVGIEASVETLPRSVYFKRASAGLDGEPEFTMGLVGWGSATGEASSPLKSLIATFSKEKGLGASNRGRYSNAEVDALLAQALATVDDAKREALLAKATEISMGEIGIVPVHFQVNTWATRKGLAYTPRTDEYTLVRDVMVK